MIRRLWDAGERFRRGRSLVVVPADEIVDASEVDGALALLGSDGDVARDLDAAADGQAAGLASLSALTTPLAMDYLDRLARPIPSLTPAAGVQVVSRGYAAHLAVERDPARFGLGGDPPILGSLPDVRHGRVPQDLLTRAVKASRRGFPAVRGVAPDVWDGFCVLLAGRVHAAGPTAQGFLSVEVVDGLARLGWVLRLIDIRYGQEPERHRS